MRHEFSKSWAEASSLKELKRIEIKARLGSPQEVHGQADVAMSRDGHRRIGKAEVLRRCAEAPAVQDHMKEGIPLAPGAETGYVIRMPASGMWDIDPEMTSSNFDAVYYQGLVEKALGDVASVLRLDYKRLTA